MALVRAFRQVDDAQVPMARRCLAPTLSNLGRRLRDLGEFDKALGITAEVLELSQALSTEDPTSYGYHVVTETGRYAELLGRAGRLDEAMEFGRRAAREFRAMAEIDPSKHLAALGRSLRILSTIYADLGRKQEATASLEEAAEVLLKRGFSDSGTLSGVVNCLDNIATSLYQIGLWQRGIEVMEVVVDARRELAEDDTPEHNSGLALSLCNLGAFYAGSGRHQDALDTTRESVAIYESLCSSNPEMYAPDWASSLNNLGMLWWQLGRPEQAHPHLTTAVNTYKRLSRAFPRLHVVKYAEYLSNLGGVLLDLGKPQEAIAPVEESHRLLLHFAPADSGEIHRSLSTCLIQMGRINCVLGQTEKGLEALREGVQVLRKMGAETDKALMPDLAIALYNLGQCLCNAKQYKPAIEPLKETVQLYQRLADEAPLTFSAKLATGLNALGASFCLIGRKEEGCQRLAEASAVLASTDEAYLAFHVALVRGIESNMIQFCSAKMNSP